jgi:2-C-methyl-D-erythritol 2,4-cyclodiphosphate synthase
MRTGIGYDIHRLVPKVERGSVPLGGFPVPCFFSLSAHSDGDVLIHAIVDAMLGSLAQGDIGQWFPDTHPDNRGRPSSEFLEEVRKHIEEMGWKVVHVDSVILLQEPKLAPHMMSIRQNLARLLNLEMSSVSVKAKTMESLGPIGEGKAIACHAVVNVEPTNNG